MDAWVLWLVLAAILAIGEMLTLGFFLAPFAGGALAAAPVAALGAGDVAAGVVFLVVSILLFWVVRPIARAHRRMPPALRTGTDALVGREAMVLERIANDEAVGVVKIDGEVWTARAFDDEVIEPGAKVHVIEIRGATALVSET